MDIVHLILSTFYLSCLLLISLCSPRVASCKLSTSKWILSTNSSFCLLCKYEKKVLETNPGSFISLDHKDVWFTRLYVAYSACIEDFQEACIPVLFLDSIFMKDRYKSTLLAAIAYGRENSLILLGLLYVRYRR